MMTLSPRGLDHGCMLGVREEYDGVIAFSFHKQHLCLMDSRKRSVSNKMTAAASSQKVCKLGHLAEHVALHISFHSIWQFVPPTPG